MLTIGEVLRSKLNSNIESINPDSSVFEAIQLMSKKNIGSLLVINKDRIVGILTERDYARKVILKNRSSQKTKVSEIMSTQVLYVTPKDSADACMALMTERCIRHLPVLEQGRLAGIISMGDIVKVIVSDRNFLIEQLTCYITGTDRVDTTRLYGIEAPPAPERLV